MDIIKIGNDALKITLCTKEAQEYGFAFNQGSEVIKEGFMRLLIDVKLHIDYPSSDKKIAGEIFTGKDGACEIFVSRVEERVYKDRIQEEVLRKIRQIFSVYSFDSLDNLICVAKRLKSIGYIGVSSLYFDDLKGKYYFLLEDVSIKELKFAFIAEYAQVVKASMIVHIKEHCRCIFKKDGVKKLSSF